MINELFGVYKVIGEDKETSKLKSKKYWKCECQKCGNVSSVRTDGLKRLPQSCPKCRYDNDYIGKQFGRLTVIKKGRTDKNGHIYWICKCQCGNIKEIAGSNLKEGKTQSCGCLHNEIISTINFIDLTGQKFGKLTVIKRANVIGNDKVMWLCQCDCGNTIIVQGNNLKNGHTNSCGCIRSKGELLIRQLLIELNYNFITEYKFFDLPNRRFDFYLPDINTCIEYDGKQHFKFINTWHQSKEEFERAKQRDNEKTEYCKKHNIPLIRIPYSDYDKLTIDYLKNIIKDTADTPDMEEAQEVADEM